jgi:hypothetical protein
MTRTPRIPSTWRKCVCAMAAPSAPGDAPVMAAGFRSTSFDHTAGRPQSIAFLSKAGMERLCSGVTNSSASAAAISALNWDDALWHFAFKVLVIHGQIVERGEMEGQLLPCKLRDRLGELAGDGFAPVAADQNGDLDLWHVWRTLVML